MAAIAGAGQMQPSTTTGARSESARPPRCIGTDNVALICTCSKAVTILRALHIEGLPTTMTAADLSTLMAPYGTVQYAEVRAKLGLGGFLGMLALISADAAEA